MIKLTLIIVLLHLISIESYQNNHPSSTSQSIISQDEIGKEIFFSDFISLSGEKFNVKSLKGKITLINFWFEGCEPCVAEFGALNKIYIQNKSNKKFKLISFTFETPANALKIANKYKLQYPIICISRAKCYQLNFNNGFPTNIITNQLGQTVYLISGGAIDTKEADKEFDNIIKIKIKELL